LLADCRTKRPESYEETDAGSMRAVTIEESKIQVLVIMKSPARLADGADRNSSKGLSPTLRRTSVPQHYAHCSIPVRNFDAHIPAKSLSIQPYGLWGVRTDSALRGSNDASRRI
jgi:hypothetical protein